MLNFVQILTGEDWNEVMYLGIQSQVKHNFNFFKILHIFVYSFRVANSNSGFFLVHSDPGSEPIYCIVYLLSYM